MDGSDATTVKQICSQLASASPGKAALQALVQIADVSAYNSNSSEGGCPDWPDFSAGIYGEGTDPDSAAFDWQVIDMGFGVASIAIIWYRYAIRSLVSMIFCTCLH